MVEYFCCPAPNPNPDMEMNETTSRYRQVLKAIVYGELGAVLGHMYLFGMLTGTFHLVHMWIDYSAYASASYCAVLIVGLCAAMELVMLFMNANDGGKMQRVIFDTSLSEAVFYTLFIWSGLKLVVSLRIHKEFKMATEGYPIGQRYQDDHYMEADTES